MSIEKTLKTIGIEPIRSLTIKETNSIITQFVELLMQAFPKQKVNKEKILKKMIACQMYFANFAENLGTANYVYQDKAIYISTKANLEEIDEYIIHECFHYLQDERDKKGRLQTLGICYFSEFKMYGMAMNEAAVQYLTCKMLNKKQEIIEYAGISVITESKNYYPLLWNLIAQMVYLIGEEALVESTLFGSETFVLSWMNIAGERVTKEIEDGFDEILNWKQAGSRQSDILEQNMAISYEKVQNEILTSYFDGMLPLIETIEEAEDYQEKLFGCRKLLGNTDQFEFYEMYQQEQLEKIEKKVQELKRKQEKKMLMVMKHSKIKMLFQMLWKFFQKGKEEYKE